MELVYFTLLFCGFQLRFGVAPASASGPDFLSGPAADTFLHRSRRYNTGLLEELLTDNLERECVEELCTFEEARETFENDEKATEFWAGYIDGNQCEPRPCLNEGTCEDHVGFYTCTCQPGFTGKTCEIVIAKRCDVNNGDCMHFCEPVETSDSKCSCATGYRLMEDGFHCEPAVPFPCGRTAAVQTHNPTPRTSVAAAAHSSAVSSPATNNSPMSEAEQPTDEAPPEEEPYPLKRIVGGTLVDTAEIPWQVALIRRPSGQLFCGGSILSKRWVITAAHCLVVSRGPFFLRVGENNVHIKEGTEQDHEVLQRHIYPHYNASESLYNHDIALLYTKKSIAFSRIVRPICTGPRAFTEALLQEASPATVSGWGRTRFLGSMADTLQKVRVPFADRAQCKRSSRVRVTPAMFCAGYHNQARDACQGDSGGPHANLLNDTWFLTGLVSWGEECARGGKYGVYTHVSHYYDWINRVMGLVLRI